ncbi:MAG: hypothetical protein F4Z00_09585 [Acidimicrobiaceae bacterium]|nr:hypothetical protein [Acidimicrobiaceae bacterium]MCY3643444.1 hypothetical protein [Acidimicrobiaceae bacterium]MDE0494578.1 hypothetical protein [Acidimicrobiaceae bacterium]MDE0666547.1 hypothetical protein [Acidimicrobiaceae bacterium]MXY09819.1 hypothetical protein [Acidimicrobiaceae bacterium]
MRSLRLGAALLALALVAAACSDDEGDGEEPTPENGAADTTTTRAATTTTGEPLVTTPTSEPPETTTTTEVPSEDAPEEATTTLAPTVSVAAPPPPSNLRCVGGSADNELLVEFDALPDPAEISKVRTYMQLEGEPVIANGEFTVGQVDTTRDGGTRWAAPVRRVPADVLVKLYATSFNQLGQESGWYSVDGLYTAAGAPCGAAADVVLPPPTGTAGFDEQLEGEPGN